MIKVRIGQYEVEVNNVSEARDLMGMVRERSEYFPVKKATKKLKKLNYETSHSDEHVVKINKKIEKTIRKLRKFTKGHRWLQDEVQYMLDNIKIGPKAMMKVKTLRERHTKMGIQQMFWKASRNPSTYTVRPEIQAIIDKHHSINSSPEYSVNKPGMFSRVLNS